VFGGFSKNCRVLESFGEFSKRHREVVERSWRGREVVDRSWRGSGGKLRILVLKCISPHFFLNFSLKFSCLP
jgi:hypothetical protein